MGRDIERRAATHGLRFSSPPVWPTDPELLHNLVGSLAARDGWGEAFTVASFKAWIVDRMPLGDPATLAHVLEPLGKDLDATISEAKGDDVAEHYAKETEAARAAGIFGSPSFVVDGEMFWGDDRLEEAIAWGRGEHRMQKRELEAAP
jgi:2-hydroxychromene-2-carboxylate isomerase